MSRLSPSFGPLCALVLSLWSARVRADPERVDWVAAGLEITQLLSEYLQVDTVNPPGNELRGAVFLAARLEREGIESEIIEIAPNRANLVARLPGSGAQPPLCLLSHIDVVPSEEESWPADRQPLSGVVDEDGLIWGRGALDMKSLGAVELMTMVLLARQKVELDRDIVLLAVADEEVYNTGIQHLIAERWDQIGCSHVINEGGMGVDGIFFEDQRAYAVSVGEKGVLWLKMVASGEPGHGSTPRDDEAPTRLLAALDRLEGRKLEPRFHPSLVELLRAAGAAGRGPTAMVLRHPRLFMPLLRARFMSDSVTRAVITDTVHVTGLGGAMEPNVVPGEVYALLDCRLLPGTRPEELLAELEELVDDPHIRFEVLSSEPAAVSPWRGDPVYEALARNVVRDQPKAVVGPAISVGFTDSIYLRALGVRAYGLAPFAVREDDLRGMHGNGEHISAEQLAAGLEILYRTLWEVAATGATVTPGVEPAD